MECQILCDLAELFYSFQTNNKTISLVYIETGKSY